MQKGFKRKFEPLRILSDSQVEQIHTASLAVLEEVGVKVESRRALKVLEEHGCRVDFDTMVARIPPAVAEAAVKNAPSSFTVRARDPDKSVMFGGNTVYFFNSAGARHVDVDSGLVTMPTLEQNNKAVLVSDALGSVNVFPSYTPYFELEGVAPVMSCPVSCAQRMRYSTKPSRGATEAESYIWEIRIAQACDCQLLGLVTSHPPLRLSEDSCNATFAYLEAGFPMYVASGSPMGAGHPVTIAAATVSHNAENLAMIVLIQSIRPGTGIILDDFCAAMNMQTGDLSFGTAASSLHQMAFNQMWHDLYQVPTSNVGSAFSNSKIVDYQLGAEKLPLAMCSALSGASLITFHGGVTAELAYNPILAVIDDDIAASIGKLIEGFEISDATIGLEAIKEVGHDGSFLGTKHTRTYWKSEDYIARVFDKTTYQEWLASGKKTVLDKARERYEELLATHQPAPLAAEQDRELSRILEEAEAYYRKKGMM